MKSDGSEDVVGGEEFVGGHDWGGGGLEVAVELGGGAVVVLLLFAIEVDFVDVIPHVAEADLVDGVGFSFGQLDDVIGAFPVVVVPRN